jgi:hypothetical protein
MTYKGLYKDEQTCSSLFFARIEIYLVIQAGHK